MRTIFTDGSASPNPGPGGFAVIENGKPIALGAENPSTNIRMEGLALKKAFEILDGEEAEILKDSEFSEMGASLGEKWLEEKKW